MDFFICYFLSDSQNIPRIAKNPTPVQIGGCIFAFTPINISVIALKNNKEKNNNFSIDFIVG